MKSAVNTRRFWLITAAALVVAGTTFSLGQWQLRRAAQKEALQSAVEAQKGQPLLDTAGLLAEPHPADLIYRPARLSGTWQGDHTIYLDNRPMNGKSGFVVVTPLLLEGSAKLVLVQRGWVQRDFVDRSRLPAITTPDGRVSITGRIAPQPSKLYEFEGVERGRIRQNLDIAAFRFETGLPLMDVSILQTEAASEGLLRNWAAPNLGVDKHYGYAFQWFALSALTVILYFWFQVLLPFRNSLSGQHRDSL